MRKHIYSTVKRRKGKGILEKEGNRDEREGREKVSREEGKGIRDQIRKGLEGRIEKMGWVEEGIWIKKEGWEKDGREGRK